MEEVGEVRIRGPGKGGRAKLEKVLERGTAFYKVHSWAKRRGGSKKGREQGKLKPDGQDGLLEKGGFLKMTEQLTKGVKGLRQAVIKRGGKEGNDSGEKESNDKPRTFHKWGGVGVVLGGWRDDRLS